jgi:hypothetical protein
MTDNNDTVRGAERTDLRQGDYRDVLAATENRLPGAYTVNAVNPQDNLVNQSKDVEWWTPPKYMELVREVLGEIDLDPASCARADKNVQARVFYDKVANGLVQPWFGRLYINSPYGKPGRGVAIAKDFIKKLLMNVKTGDVTEAIALLNSNSIEAEWFRPLRENCTLCVCHKRIQFLDPAGRTAAPNHGAVFVYLGPRIERFIDVFRKIGTILRAPQMTDVNDTLKAATRTAARLLCEWPDIDVNDRWLVIDRCLTFEVHLQGPKIGYGYENVKVSVLLQRHLAGMASKHWTPEELHRDAQRCYDHRYKVDEQSDDFYLAQAQYHLVKRIHHGDQSQSQNAVA